VGSSLVKRLAQGDAAASPASAKAYAIELLAG
jgi:hypothetical protein